ncbi:MAG: c-type cytochrome [Pseudomonadota bacterium]
MQRKRALRVALGARISLAQLALSSVSLCSCSSHAPEQPARPITTQPAVPVSASPSGPDGGAIDDGGVDSGSPPPVTDSSGTKCVNGVAVPDGSTIETGGTAPAVPSTRSASLVPPLSGGTLIALADGRTLVASDPDRDRVYVFDASASAVSATVSLQAGDEPGRLVEDAAGRVHVLLRRGGALVTLDPKLGSVQARRAVCPAPRGITYDQATDQLHVACAGGELVSLAASGGSPTRRLAFERDLRDVVMGANGSLLVSTFRKAEVLVIGSDGQLNLRLRPSSGPVQTLEGAARMRTPSVAWRMLSLDEASNSVVVLHQTGVTDTIDTAPGGYAGRNGCSGIVAVGVSVLSPSGASPPVATGFGGVPLAIDLALSPDHQKIALAVPGNGSHQGPTLIERTLQDATPSTARDCGSDQNDILQPPSNQVVAVSYAPGGVLFAQTREPAAIWRADTGESTLLAPDSPVDMGHFVFHANSGAGISCASCHPEGGEDGRTWSFICAGPRRTQSMRGGISATAPFHWDGSETDLTRLVEDVFSGRMAGPLLEPDQMDALRAWIETIPPMPDAAGLDAAAVTRGRALFDDSKLACATCHGGAAMTNNRTMDVGTGRAFQVPSLRGLSWRDPFMHDGCAKTLSDRFGVASCSGGDKHGLTAALSANQVNDLVQYLQSL